MFNIGPWELVLILFIALIVFGPGKLPEVAKGLGKAVNEFKQASSGIKKTLQDDLQADEPTSAEKKQHTDSIAELIPASDKSVATAPLLHNEPVTEEASLLRAELKDKSQE